MCVCADPVLVPRHSLFVFVSRLRRYSAACVIVRCVGVVFERHLSSPDTTVDAVSSAMLTESTFNLPGDVDADSDGRMV